MLYDIQVWSMVLVVYGAIIVPFALGAAYAVRYFKTRDRRALKLALLLGFVVPVVLLLAIYGYLAWMAHRIQAETVY
jgi:ABC-type Fe3+ transport system permease subunit